MAFLKARAHFVVWYSYGLILAILVAPAALNWTVNGDLYWQRWLGFYILAHHQLPGNLGAETLSAPGAPWIPQEWLLGVFLALSEPIHAYWVLAALAIAGVLLTMILGNLRTTRRGTRTPVLLGLCVILIGISVLGPFGVRAQVFAWPLFALLLFLLDDGGPVVYWAIPLVAIWANIHASAVIAPVMAILYLMGILLDKRQWSPKATRYAILIPVLGLAMCINPLGYHLPLYAIALSHSPIRVFIGEWQKTGISSYGLWAVIVPMCFGFVYLLWKKQRFAWTDVLVLLSTGYLAWSAVRNIPIFAIAAAPILCSGLERVLGYRVRRKDQYKEKMLQIAMASVILPAICALSFVWFTKAYALGDVLLPRAAMAKISQIPGPKRVFCYDFSDCGLALGNPHIRMFMDGRCDPFPWPVWEKYRILLQARPGWEHVLDSYDVTLVLTPQGALLNGPLKRSPLWKQIYYRDGFLVFQRRG